MFESIQAHQLRLQVASNRSCSNRSSSNPRVYLSSKRSHSNPGTFTCSYPPSQPTWVTCRPTIRTRRNPWVRSGQLGDEIGSIRGARATSLQNHVCPWIRSHGFEDDGFELHSQPKNTISNRSYLLNHTSKCN